MTDKQIQDSPFQPIKSPWLRDQEVVIQIINKVLELGEPRKTTCRYEAELDINIRLMLESAFGTLEVFDRLRKEDYSNANTTCKFSISLCVFSCIRRPSRSL